MTTSLSTRPDGFPHLAQAVIMQMGPDFEESSAEWFEVAVRASDEKEPPENLYAQAMIATAVDLAMQVVASEAWQLQEQTDWCNRHAIDRVNEQGDWYT